jgi:hypothetical protein
MEAMVAPSELLLSAAGNGTAIIPGGGPESILMEAGGPTSSSKGKELLVGLGGFGSSPSMVVAPPFWWVIKIFRGGMGSLGKRNPLHPKMERIIHRGIYMQFQAIQ